MLQGSINLLLVSARSISYVAAGKFFVVYNNQIHLGLFVMHYILIGVLFAMFKTFLSLKSKKLPQVCINVSYCTEVSDLFPFTLSIMIK